MGSYYMVVNGVRVDMEYENAVDLVMTFLDQYPGPKYDAGYCIEETAAICRQMREHIPASSY